MPTGPGQSQASQTWTRVFTALVVLIAAGCLAGIVVPAGLGWDFANFYDAGRRVASGQIGDLYNPLSPINGMAPQGRTGFFGAPLSALFYLPLAPFSAETALILFKIQNVCAFAATFALLLAFYRPLVGSDEVAQRRFMALFALLFLIFQPFWTVFRVGGQTTPTVLLLLSAGLVTHTRGRFWGSAICVVLAALVKPALAPAVLVLAAVAGFAFLWRLGVVLAISGALSLVLMGWPVHAAFLELMSKSSQLTYAWYFNSSIYILFNTIQAYAGSGSDWARILAGLTFALKALVVATALVLTYRSRRQDWPEAARRHFDFTLATLFFLLWSPTVWEHYLSLLFPFLIFILATREHFSRQAVAIVGLIFLLSIGQNLILINWVRYSFAIDSLPELVVITFIKSGPLLLTVWFLWRHAGELLRSHAGSFTGTR